ncbi:MAG: hypothetical protein N3F03_02825 [Ignavibacteria bacterium]|nr:hypothetical protein [Ignavibacteria bacterium]
MDSILDLLIILFIIYAFLAPIFKRKPPVAKKPQPQHEAEETEFEGREEKSSQEILREIEELFGYKTPQQPEYEVDTYTQEKDEEFTPIKEEKLTEPQIQESKFEEKVKLASTDFEQKVHQDFKIEAYDYEATIPDIEIDEFDYTKLDEYDYTKPEVEAEKTHDSFTFQLNNLDDFKRAIVFKEIFDTPLALRMRRIKWQRNIY